MTPFREVEMMSIKTESWPAMSEDSAPTPIQYDLIAPCARAMCTGWEKWWRIPDEIRFGRAVERSLKGRK